MTELCCTHDKDMYHTCDKDMYHTHDKHLYHVTEICDVHMIYVLYM